MKYHVYAALIATTQSGPIADQFERDMPTEAETQAVEDTLTSWAEQAENIHAKVNPIIQTRNQKIIDGWNVAKQEGEQIIEHSFENLEGEVDDLVEEIEEIESNTQEDLENAGVIADYEALEDKIRADIQACQQSMRSVRASTKALKTRKRMASNTQSLGQYSDEFHDAMPTKQQVAEVEGIVTGWVDRAEQINIDATPAVEARNNRFVDAWEIKTASDEQVFFDTIEDLEDAQKDFEEELMEAEAYLEQELTQNGTKADVEALGDQIDADLRTMDQMYKKVQRIQKKVSLIKRASIKMSTNLTGVSAQMEANQMSAEEYEAKKQMVISWVSDYEDILEKSEPIARRREAQLEDAWLDAAEEADEILIDAVEDMEEEDQKFQQVHYQADRDAEDQIEASGAVEEFEDLFEEIDATLSNMERSMSKVRRSVQLLKRQAAVRNTQSLSTAAQLEDSLPTGAEVEQIQGMVNGWVQSGEAIVTKAKPAVERYSDQEINATMDKQEEVEETVMQALGDMQESEDAFIYEVQSAQDAMVNSLNNTGVISDIRELDQDIENQFNTWDQNMQNMRKRAPVQSLTAKQNKSVSKQLKSLQADLDRVLKSM